MTNKEKCIHMWEWLVKNPSKNKDDYVEYLLNHKIPIVPKGCYACYEASTRQQIALGTIARDSNMCAYCPVAWTPQQKSTHTVPNGGCYYYDECCHSSSPYYKWDQTDPLDVTLRETHAKEVLNLIVNEWKE